MRVFAQQSCRFLGGDTPCLSKAGLSARQLGLSARAEACYRAALHPQNDKHELSGIFTDLCKRVESDLERKGYASRTIGIKLRFADFSIVTRDLTLPAPVICPGISFTHCCGTLTVADRI